MFKSLIIAIALWFGFTSTYSQTAISKRFDVTKGLAKGKVNSITKTEDGVLNFTLTSGFSRYDGKKVDTYDFINNIHNENILDAVSYKDYIALATDERGIFLVNKNRRIERRIDRNVGAENSYRKLVSLSPDKLLGLAKNKITLLYNDSIFSITPSNPELITVGYFVSAANLNGDTYVLHETGGLFKVNFSNRKLVKDGITKKAPLAAKLLTSNDSALFLVTNTEIISIGLSGQTKIQLEEGINCSFSNSEIALFGGEFGLGKILPNGHFKKFHWFPEGIHPTSLFFDSVENLLWVGTSNSGIFCFDFNRLILKYRYKGLQRYTDVKFIDSTLYFTDGSNVFRRAAKKPEITNLFYPNTSGYIIPNDLPKDTRSMGVFNDDTILLNYQWQIGGWAAHTFTPFDQKEIGATIQDFFLIDSTFIGVNQHYELTVGKLKTGKFKSEHRIALEPFLEGRNIRWLAGDSAHFFVGSDLGIICGSTKDLIAKRAPKIFWKYSYQSITGNEPFRAVSIGKNDTLYACNQEAIYVIPLIPEICDNPKHTQPYSLGEIAINGIPQELAKNVSINAISGDWISGSISGIQYRYEPKFNLQVGNENGLILERYIEGDDFTISNLPNGKYWVNITEKGSFHSLDQTIQFQLVINPPLTKRWWFLGGLMMLMFSAILITILYIFRRRERRRRDQYKLFKSEVKALQSQMNPHYLYNSLNTVQSFIATGEADKAMDYLNDFASIVRNTLETSHDLTTTLETELIYLKSYLELESIRFSGRFSYHVEIDENIDTEEIKIPPMILQPCIENAINHGLLPLREKNGFVQLVISETDENTISIKVVDNGIGMEAAKSRKTNGTGIALKNIKNRIQLLNGLDDSVSYSFSIFSNAKSPGTTCHLKISYLNS